MYDLYDLYLITYFKEGLAEWIVEKSEKNSRNFALGNPGFVFLNCLKISNLQANINTYLICILHR